MTDIVDDTLKFWRRHPFVWGAADCLLSIGDYIAARGGHDVSALFRGTYDSEAGAMAHIERYGGVEGLIDLTGLVRIDPADAKRGDVMVLDTGDVMVGALCTGSGVAARVDRGVVEVSRRLVTTPYAWRVP